MILNTEFGLIWTTPWPDGKQLFLKFSKIRNSQNSPNSVRKTFFFLSKPYQQPFGFTLSLHWWYSIPSLVWFGQLLDSMKKNSFKIPFSRNSQISVRKPNFFRGKLYQFYFALHCHYTGDTQYRVSFDLGNSLTRWKTTIFKILKNSQFAKFAKFRTKNHFFLGKLYQQLFCFTLSLHWWYSIPSLIWFGQLLDPLKKNFFLNSQKSAIREIRKIPYENSTFS